MLKTQFKSTVEQSSKLRADKEYTQSSRLRADKEYTQYSVFQIKG
jgi:hypothetical protein